MTSKAALPRQTPFFHAGCATAYDGGTNSCFLNQPLHWRYKQLLPKDIPTLEVQTVAF